MKKFKLIFVFAILVSLQNFALKAGTVVDIIVNSPDHETLETAVVAAELADDLSGDGPFTVFAPTDEAFAALPAGVLNDLLADPTGDLANILLYHVLGGNVMSGDLSDGISATTLLGKDIDVKINMDGVFINDAEVIVADLEADNGVVHVLDVVLVPPTTTVVDIIINSPDHETLETAVVAAELADDLSGDGPFTVFAPTDEAFAALPAGVLNDLLADPTGALAEVLLYHVVGAEALSGDLSDGQIIETLLEEDIEVTINGEGVFVNDLKVIVADIQADNGVVHVIDAVLVPSMEPTALNSNDFNTTTFDLYPNPASDYVNINIVDDNFQRGTINIIDTSGMKVMEYGIDESMTSLNVSELNKGLYFIVFNKGSQNLSNTLLVD